MIDQTDPVAAHRMDEEKRLRETQEVERRRQQQIIEDDERHVAERRSRGSVAAEPQRPDTGAVDRGVEPGRAARPADDPQRSSAQKKEEEKNPTDLPLSGEAARSTGSGGIGPVGLLVMVLLLVVSCYAGWRVFNHLTAPATPVDATAGAIDPSPLPLPAVVGADENAAGQEAASLDPALSGPALATQPTNAATTSLPVEAGLPGPAPAMLTDEVELAGRAEPPTPDPRITQISERLDRLELVLADIRDRLTARPEPSVVAASAPVAAAPEPRPTAARKPVRTAGKPAPQTISNDQLLSVDMWGGVPSVVVGTGLPDDKRVRVLKRGDVHNGVALLNVDPVAKTATFGANGRSFTLSVNQGG